MRKEWNFYDEIFMHYGLTDLSISVAILHARNLVQETIDNIVHKDKIRVYIE